MMLLITPIIGILGAITLVIYWVLAFMLGKYYGEKKYLGIIDTLEMRIDTLTKERQDFAERLVNELDKNASLEHERNRINAVNVEDFPPQELKSIEIDVERKIFQINKKDFGKGTASFSIACTPKASGNQWDVQVKLDQRLRYVSYNGDGDKIKDRTFNKVVGGNEVDIS